MLWWINALVKKILSIFPFGRNLWDLIIRLMLGKNWADWPRFKKNLIYQVSLIKTLKKYSFLKNKTILEIGTGWFALGAFCLYLYDSKKIITVDINRHLNKNNFINMISILKKKINELSKITGLPKKKIENKLNKVNLKNDLSTLLRHCNIFYECPYKIRDIENKNFDIIFSMHVLEHLKLKDIYNLAKVKKDKLIQAHSWDMGDHFSYKDKSINVFNFLKFSDFIWEKIIMNSISYQNRLREKDIIAIFQKEGYHVVYRDSNINLALENKLKKIRINKKFYIYGTKDLIKISSITIFNK